MSEPKKMQCDTKRFSKTKVNSVRKGDKISTSEREAKRRKTEDVTKPVEKENKRWSVADAEVEPEMLKEMGVGKLVEECVWYSETSSESTCSMPIVTGPVEKNDSITKDETSFQRITEKLIEINTNNAVQLTPDNSQEKCQKKEVKKKADASKAKLETISEDFFVYRRNKYSNLPKEDVFSKLSDEIILMIFRWLPKKMLIRNALVCKRWHRISYDETFWVRLDLANRAVSSGALGYILSRGTTILRLAQSEFSDPVFLDDSMDVTFKLQFLDLSMAVISKDGLCSLLRTCKHLKKLSLEHCQVNDDVCDAIGRNTRLEVLNMSSCYGITDNGLESIVNGCRILTNVNLAWTDLSRAALNTLAEDTSATLERLNISGCRKTLDDVHVEVLTETCSNLVELDMSDCTNLTEDSISSVLSLSRLEHLALSRCYGIPPAAYRRLAELDSLSFLDVFSAMADVSIAALQGHLPAVTINKFVHSSVARPTVGIRRTSIWGLRVRD